MTLDLIRFRYPSSKEMKTVLGITMKTLRASKVFGLPNILEELRERQFFCYESDFQFLLKFLYGLRLWASRPVLICMSGLDNVWSPLQPEKKPRILLYKWDHIPPAQSWWLSLTPVLFDVWVQDTEVEVFQGSPVGPQRWSVPSGRTHLSSSQHPFLQNASEAGQKQIIGSAGILSFFIWMAFLSQCDSKTTDLAITLILNLQKLVNSLID